MKTKANKPGADWKGDLQRLLNANNERHATRHKVVSHGTQESRAEGLFRILGQVRAGGFRIGPAMLGGRHIEFLMRYWTADPSIEAGLRERRSQLKMRSSPLSAAYIQQQLSFLRTLSTWIDKPGLVLQAHRYVSDSALVTRNGNATRDRTWSGASVDRQAVLDRVARADPVVGLQLEVSMVFGLRPKEAVMFSPALAEVPAHALPASASPGDYLAFLRVKRGTKGGRVRFLAIRNDEQRAVLARALLAAPRPGMHIGRPEHSLKQAMTRFSNVVRRCGVTRRELGVTAYGLRHEFAADLYFELTNVPAPIKGGPVHLDAGVMTAAYLEVARQLGHGRLRITGAYLGSRRAPADKKPADSDGA